MFSITTMPLSTSMPMAMVMAPRVMMLRSSPVKYITTSEKSTLKGMAKATMTVGLGSRRKSASTTMASAAPSSRVLSMVQI